MRFRKRPSPVSDSGDTGKVDKVDKVDEGRPDPEQGAGAADALARAEEAEAQAAEAEAAAEAARARAHAIRLRQQANAAATDTEATEATDTEATGDSSATPSETGTEPTTNAEGSDGEPECDATDQESGAEPDKEPAATAAEEHACEEVAGDETADEEYDEAVAGETQPRPKSRRSALKVAASTVALLVICALLGVSGYFIWHHQQALDREQQAAEFEAAARQGVVTLMSLNFETAKEDVQRIIDSSTGDFRKEFEAQAEDFTKVAQGAQVKTEADVHASGIKSMAEDTAVVLVTATSTVTNKSGAEEDPRRWRLAISVARDGDQVKMSKVEFVP